MLSGLFLWGHYIECDNTQVMKDIKSDNNGSERAIRNIKVKQKVSYQYKSQQGAKDYSNLRSIIDTARIRDMNEFETISSIVSGISVF